MEKSHSQVWIESLRSGSLIWRFYMGIWPGQFLILVGYSWICYILKFKPVIWGPYESNHSANPKIKSHLLVVVFELLILFPSHFDTLEWSSIYKHGKRSPTWLSAYILCLLKHALGQFVIGHIDFCRSFRGLKRKVNLVHWRIVSIYTIQVPIFQSSTIQICLGIDHCILCQFFSSAF